MYFTLRVANCYFVPILSSIHLEKDEEKRRERSEEKRREEKKKRKMMKRREAKITNFY